MQGLGQPCRDTLLVFVRLGQIHNWQGVSDLNRYHVNGMDGAVHSLQVC
jgi:hypothetical protein